MRTYDTIIIDKAVNSFQLRAEDFDPVKWVSVPENTAITNDEGDVALFTHERPGVVTGHYCFQSRGRKAITVGIEFLKEFWQSRSDVQVILGLTPLDNLGARWMSRHLGFTSHGVVSTTIGPHEIFIMHRTEYELK